MGSTADWAATDAKTVFTFLFGSYFGDWDSGDNFLRAPLASATYGLTSAWSGRPLWYAQAMAIGETIGYGTKITQNNTTYSPFNFGNQLVHVALMGDPTLRLHPVIPPGTPWAKIDGYSHVVGLFWTASPDATLGYHIYRASTNPGDTFARFTKAPIAGTSFVDSGMPSGSYRYMVRAVKRELVAAGSYVNASQGTFLDVMVP